jgi:hypothetical protein
LKRSPKRCRRQYQSVRSAPEFCPPQAREIGSALTSFRSRRPLRRTSSIAPLDISLLATAPCKNVLERTQHQVSGVRNS